MAAGEAQRGLRVLKYQSKILSVGALLALSAGFFFLTFLLLNLGGALGSLTLGALALTVAFGLPALLLIARGVRNLKRSDLAFPETRRSLEEVRDLIPPARSTPESGETRMAIGHSEVNQGKDQWSLALEEFKGVFERLLLAEKSVEKVVRDGARGAAYVVPVAAAAYLGFWAARRRVRREDRAPHIPNTMPIRR